MDRFGTFLDKAKSRASSVGIQAATALKAGQAQINQQIQARETSSTAHNADGTQTRSTGFPSVSNGMMKLDDQLKFDLASECDKTEKILRGFLTQSPDTDLGKRRVNVIPNEVVKRAKGFAVFTVIKAGFMFSGRVGSGLVFARLPDGTWSAPSCIGTAGFGYGLQIGADITEVVVVLNSQAAVEAFSQGGNVTIGGNVSASAGPVGTGAQINAALKHPAPMFSYTRSKGLFAGVSIEGTVLIERKDANKAFYGSPLSATAILTGQVPPPERANAMYEIVEAAEGLMDVMTPHEEVGGFAIPAQSTIPNANEGLGTRPTGV